MNLSFALDVNDHYCQIYTTFKLIERNIISKSQNFALPCTGQLLQCVKLLSFMRLLRSKFLLSVLSIYKYDAFCKKLHLARKQSEEQILFAVLF